MYDTCPSCGARADGNMFCSYCDTRLIFTEVYKPSVEVVSATWSACSFTTDDEGAW